MPLTPPTSPRASVSLLFFSFSVVSALHDPMACGPLGSSCPWNSPGKNTGESCSFLLQGISPIQRSNPCLLHWQVNSLHWATREAQSKCWLLTNPRLACVSSSGQSPRSPVSGSSPRPGDIIYTVSPWGGRMQFCGSVWGEEGSPGPQEFSGFLLQGSSSWALPSEPWQQVLRVVIIRAPCSTVMDSTGSAQTQDWIWTFLVTFSLKC